MMFGLYAAWYLEACAVYGAYSLGLLSASIGSVGVRNGEN